MTVTSTTEPRETTRDSTEPRPSRSHLKSSKYLSRQLMNSTYLVLGDFMALTLAMLFGGGLRQWLFGDSLIPAWSWLILPVWLGGAAFTSLTPGWGVSPVEHLRKLTTLITASFGLAAAALFLTQTGAEASRFTLTTAFLTALIFVPLLRVRVKSSLIRSGKWGVPTAIYGNDATSSHVLQALDAEPGLGYIPFGLFDDESKSGSFINGVPVLGTMDQNTADAPYAIISTGQLGRERLIELLEGPLTIYRRVILIPDLIDAPSLWVTPRDFVGLVGLEVAVNLLNPFARIAKRIADVILVVLMAPIWIPLFLILSALIWLEDHASPFFIQERLGGYGKRFNTMKFRTMYPNAEQILEKKLAEDADLAAEWAIDCKLRDDPRITRIGRFLRKTSLDELPQLINVLRGEMSLVGPRPLPEYHHEQLSAQTCALRDRVRPGLTGLWQVSGRSESGTAGMERWDAYYVRNWSVWLDIVILVRTIRVVFSGKGAY